MTAAAWPTEIWTHQGVKPFTDPNPSKKLIKSLGFTPGDQFTAHTGVRIKEGVDVAQVVDSNLFKVAAGAVGVDWASFRAKLVAKEGMEKALGARVYVQDSQDGALKWIDRSAWEADQPTGRYTARFTKTDEAGNKIDYSKGESHVTDEDGDDYQDWGKTDSGEVIDISSDEKKDLDKMQEWLKDNEKNVSRSTSSAWDNPPSGHEYGFDNDNLWEALGIDPSKPPPPAQHLNVDYDYNLLAPRQSFVNIPVPPGYELDHPGHRSGSFINTVMASEVSSRNDMTGIPVQGHTYPGGAHPQSGWADPTVHQNWTSPQPKAGDTHPVDPNASYYRK